MSATLEVLSDHSEHCVSPFAVVTALDDLREPLLLYLANCVGVDPDNPPTDQPEGKTQPLTEYLDSLYKLATGWLGWTPQVALDSTPAEIVLAYQGRLDLLQAIFGGSSEDKPAQQDTAFTDANVKKLFATIGARKVKGSA